MKTDVVVVGGGIAGLAAAYRLHNAGLEIVLLERGERLGGKIRTEHVDGFTVEAGPDSFLTTKPGAIALARELGMETELQAPAVGGARVRRGGKLYPLPEGLSGLVPARLGPLLRSSIVSPLGRARLSLEQVIPARRAEGDETLAAFMRRRFGREAYDRLIEPLMSGIYAGNGDELSLEATFPQLRAAERDRGSLMRALSSRPHPTRSPFLTPRGGVQALVDRLAAALGTIDVRLNANAVGISRSGNQWIVSTARGGEITAASVIVSVPAFAAADLLLGVDADLAATLNAIPYVSVATVSLAFREEDIVRRPEGSGYLIPRCERRPVLAVTWVSNKWANRAAPGTVLVRAFFGRAGRQLILENPDPVLVNLARTEIGEVLGVDAAPVLERVFRFPRAMPQYTLGHLARIAAIERRLRIQPGLFLAGHAYRGLGIPDCIVSGEGAARAAREHTAAKSPAA